MDAAQFIVILLAAIAGLTVIRFAASYFVKVLAEHPSLETAAMLLVGWVGVKLFVHTLAHPSFQILSQDFVEGPIWKTLFWTVMLLIALGGWSESKEKKHKGRAKIIEVGEFGSWFPNFVEFLLDFVE